MLIRTAQATYRALAHSRAYAPIGAMKASPDDTRGAPEMDAGEIFARFCRGDVLTRAEMTYLLAARHRGLVDDDQVADGEDDPA